MHLIWANLIPNLILLWTRKFKDLDHDNKGYVLAPHVWRAIREATLNAGQTIPAAFGSRVPNIAAEKSQMTAETHSIWIMYLAPTLLNSWFIIRNLRGSWYDQVAFVSSKQSDTCRS